MLDVLVRLTTSVVYVGFVGCRPRLAPVSSLGNRGLHVGIPSCMRGKQSGSGVSRKNHVGHLIQSLVLQHSSQSQ